MEIVYSISDTTVLIKNNLMRPVVARLCTRLVMVSIPTRGNGIFILNYISIFFVLVYRQSAALSSVLNTQCLQNPAESGERSVLTLGSLCLLRIQHEADLPFFYFNSL